MGVCVGGDCWFQRGMLIGVSVIHPIRLPSL